MQVKREKTWRGGRCVFTVPCFQEIPWWVIMSCCRKNKTFGEKRETGTEDQRLPKHGSHLWSSYEHFGWMVAGLECGKSKWVGRAWWTIQHKYITTTMLMYFEAKKSKDKELWCWRRKWGEKKECSICKSMVLIRGVEDHRDLRARFRIAGAITLRILLQSVLDYFFILCCIAFARTYKNIENWWS